MSAAAAFDRELKNFQLAATDLHVGVNHSALDKERLCQEQYLEGLLYLEERIQQKPEYIPQFSEPVENLKNSIRLNADVLAYLKRITKIEGHLTELTCQVTQAAVDASTPHSAPKTVFANKALTENVANCWEYVAQLSSITQAHLKDAAAYQQFYHMVHEVEAHIEKMVGLAEMKMALFDPHGTIEEAAMMSSEITDDYRDFARTWEQTCQLTETSRHLRPVQHRLARVVFGRTTNNSPGSPPEVVMVKALISFSGPDFAIRKGEEMLLMSNENQNFWSVQTTQGEREVPSVIFAPVGANQDGVFKASSLQKKCVSDWKRVLERIKGKLVKFYTKVFENYCRYDYVYFSQESQMNAFLDDLDHLLIAPNYDGGVLHALSEQFTKTLMLISGHRRPPDKSIIITDADLLALHSPLLRFIDQAEQVDRVQTRVTMTAEEVQMYLKSVENERERISKEISMMEKLQQDNENELKNLSNRVQTWKTKRLVYDNAITDFNEGPVGDMLEHFPTNPLPKPRAVGNDYRNATTFESTDSDLYEANSGQTETEYGHVAKQIVFTSGKRQKQNGVTFASGVVKDRDGRTFSGSAMALRKCASMNDLQTQILYVTASKSTQYEEDDRCPLSSRLRTASRTNDAMAQIFHMVEDVSCQVGVRVTPTAIDLSRVEFGNLGLEVRDRPETSSLGLRVGQVLCPVTVGTRLELHDGPGVEVLGINDVDSLNVHLRDSVAHGSSYFEHGRRRLKVRDVQAQVSTKPEAFYEPGISEQMLSKNRKLETNYGEAQTQICISSKPIAVQAVAAMEVIDIPSMEPKRKISEAATTTLRILPDLEQTTFGYLEGSQQTSDVMTQISCLLHTRGIHSDLSEYLNDYLERRNQSSMDKRTGDLETQISKLNADSSSQYCPPTHHVETLIAYNTRNSSTQVSSKLVPMEVTVGQIKTENMELSFTTPLKEANFDFSVDALVCPANIKFASELYEGSDLVVADYSGVNNLRVSTNEGSVVVGALRQDQQDQPNQVFDGFETSAAIVLKATNMGSGKDDRRRIGEVIATKGYMPQLHLAAIEMCARDTSRSRKADGLVSSEMLPIYTDTSDTQTQISQAWKLGDLENNACTQCRRNYSDLQTQIKGDSGGQMAAYRAVHRENYCSLVDDKPTQTSSHAMQEEDHANSVKRKVLEFESAAEPYSRTSMQIAGKPMASAVPRSSSVSHQLFGAEKGQGIDADVQVGVELTPMEIQISRCDIEDMQLEFEDVRDLQSGQEEAYTMRMTSVACPAKMKVKTQLVDGSGVCFIGVKDVKSIGFSVNPKRAESNTCLVGVDDSDIGDDFSALIAFEQPVKRSRQPNSEMRSSGKSLSQRHFIRLVPEGTKAVVGTSDAVVQIFKVTNDAASQVGLHLVPNAIAVSPVSLANTEVVSNDRSRGTAAQQSIGASTLLYPADVQMTGLLVEDATGVQILPITQVETMQLNHGTDPFDETHLRYAASETIRRPKTGTFELQTSIGEATRHFQETQAHLPAGIVLGTNQFDGERRIPCVAEQSLIASLLEGAKKEKRLTIRAKSGAVENGLVEHIGWITKEQDTQTPIDEALRYFEPLGTATRVAKTAQKTAGVQVGTKLVPISVEVANIPVGNLQVESTSAEKKSAYTVDSLVCPSKIRMKTELCEVSGIHVCSLEDTDEILVQIQEKSAAAGGATSKPVTSDYSTPNKGLANGWWSSIKRTPSTEIRPHQNAMIRLPKEGLKLTTTKLQSRECNLMLQAETVLKPTVGSIQSRSDSMEQFKLVVTSVEAPRGSSRSGNSSTTFNQSTKKTLEFGMQVGTKLVPKTVEVQRILLENMEVSLMQKDSQEKKNLDISAILCSSGIKYGSELTDASGIEVVRVKDTEELSIQHGDHKYATSVITGRQRTFGEGNISSTAKRYGVQRGSMSSVAIFDSRQIQDDYRDAGEEKYEAKLHVKREEYSLDHSLRPQWRSGGNRYLKDATSQVGAALIPAEFSMERIDLEVSQLDFSDRRSNRVEASGVLCPSKMSLSTILCENAPGIVVAPVSGSHNFQVACDNTMYDAEVVVNDRGSRKRITLKEQDIPSSKPERSLMSIPLVQREISSISNKIASSHDVKASLKHVVSEGVQVGILLVPTQICMDAVDVEKLSIQMPPRGERDIEVSAILTSSGLKMTPVLTDKAGIEIGNFTSTGEVGIQLGDDVYVANVRSPSTMEGSTSTRGVRRDGLVVFLPISNSRRAQGLSRNAEGLLNQSTGLRTLCADLQTAPNLRLTTSEYSHPARVTFDGDTTFAASGNAFKRAEASSQVGLNLVPQSFEMNGIKVHHAELAANHPVQTMHGNHAGDAMPFYAASTFDQVLTDKPGVTVLPIESSTERENSSDEPTNCTTVYSRRRPESGLFSSGQTAKQYANLGQVVVDRSPCNHVERYTQVGTILVPTELSMQQMSLDTSEVVAKHTGIREGNVLCPMDMKTSTVLGDFSGVEMAQMRGVSEIDILLGGCSYTADLVSTTSSESSQTSVRLHEKPITGRGRLQSASIALCQPSIVVGQMESSSGSVSSRSVHRSQHGQMLVTQSTQAGVVLVPTAVAMERVRVKNLEVEVPLNPSRSAKVTVSAVLASSATELTSVLTTNSGIQVIPITEVDEIGIQHNGRRHVGVFDGHVASGSSDRKTHVLPITQEYTTGPGQYLLNQSADLRHLHNALSAGVEVTALGEPGDTSEDQYGRPALLRPSASCGDFVSPHKNTHLVSSIPQSSRDTNCAEMQAGGRFMGQTGEAPPRGRPSTCFYCGDCALRQEEGTEARRSNVSHSSTQVGAVLVPQNLSLEKMKLDTTIVDGGGSRSRVETVLCPTDMQLATVLSESSGVKVVTAQSGFEIEFDEGRYSTEVTTSSPGNQATIKVLGKCISRAPEVGQMEVSICRPRPENTASISATVGSLPSLNHFSMSSKLGVNAASQVGTLLVPTTVCMDRIDVQNLALDIPVTGTDTREVNVSAILASSSTQFDPLLTDSAGIQVLDMKDTKELGIQLEDKVYLATVIASPSKYTTGAFGPRLVCNQGAVSCSHPDHESLTVAVHGVQGLSTSEDKSFVVGSASSRRLEMHLQNVSLSGSQPAMIAKETQVGTVLVPMEIALKQVTLDASQIGQYSSRDKANVFCPTDMQVRSILTEDSEVRVADVGGGIKLGVRFQQSDYIAEMAESSVVGGVSCMRLKLQSAAYEGVTPTERVSMSAASQPEVSRRSEQTAGGASMKKSASISVQVGTLLVPTKVHMDRIKVDSLEIEVPLKTGRNAEVTVGAVLASMATEMESVLTASSGIQMLPLAEVRKIGIQNKDKLYVTGTRHTADRPHGTGLVHRDAHTIQVPLHHYPDRQNRETISSQNIIAHSTDLAQLHEALANGSASVKLQIPREESFRRPGVLYMEQVVPERAPANVFSCPPIPTEMVHKETQVGVHLVPQSVEITSIQVENMETVSRQQAVSVASLICASGIGYKAMLREGSGVEMENLESAEHLKVQHGKDIFHATVMSRYGRSEADIATRLRVCHLEQSCNAAIEPASFNRLSRRVEGDYQTHESPQDPSVPMARNRVRTTSDVDDVHTGSPVRVAASATRQESAAFVSAAGNWINTSCQHCGRRRTDGETELPQHSIKDETNVIRHNDVDTTRQKERGTFSCPCGRLYANTQLDNRHLKVICTTCESAAYALPCDESSTTNVQAHGTGIKQAGRDVGIQISAPNHSQSDDPNDETIVAFECVTDGKYRPYLPDYQFEPVVESQFSTRQSLVNVQVATQCSIIPRDSLEVMQVNKSLKTQPMEIGGHTSRIERAAYSTYDDEISLGTTNRPQSADSLSKPCTACQRMLALQPGTVIGGRGQPIESMMTIQRGSDEDLRSSSMSTSVSRTLSQRRNVFFLGTSSARSSGRRTSARRYGEHCSMCNRNMTSGDLSTSVISSRLSLVDVGSVVADEVKEIAEAYTSTDTTVSIFATLKHNRIIQAVIADYEKATETIRYADANELAETATRCDNAVLYKNIQHNPLVQRVIESYESTEGIRGAPETSLSMPRDIKQIADAVASVGSRQEASVASQRTLYVSLKGNPIIQRVVREYETDRATKAFDLFPPKESAEIAAAIANANILGAVEVTPAASSLYASIKNTRLTKRLIAEYETEKRTAGCNVFMESERVPSAQISSTSRRPTEKPLSSSVSSGEEEDDRQWTRPQWSPLHTNKVGRCDVSCSAMITPESWDKKVQVSMIK